MWFRAKDKRACVKLFFISLIATLPLAGCESDDPPLNPTPIPTAAPSATATPLPNCDDQTNSDWSHCRHGALSDYQDCCLASGEPTETQAIPGMGPCYDQRQEDYKDCDKACADKGCTCS